MNENQKNKIKPASVVSAGVRIGAAFLAGIAVALLVGIIISWEYAPLAGWDAAAIIFVGWIFFSLHGSSHEQTAGLAKIEDPGHAIGDLLLVLASVASLGAVGVLIAHAGSSNGFDKDFIVASGLVSVVISWILVHTVYMLKYARLYYRHDGGIDFYSNVPPKYSDFAYVAFTIGMTFQVSDNNFTTNEFRRIALRHALLSFLFGAVIVATLVNFIAGLAK